MTRLFFATLAHRAPRAFSIAIERWRSGGIVASEAVSTPAPDRHACPLVLSEEVATP